jgi:hypothetical protein
MLQKKKKTLVQAAHVDILTGGNECQIVSNLDTAEAVYRTFGSRRVLLCSWVRAEPDLSGGCLETARSAFKECLSKSMGVYPNIAVLCLAALRDPQHRMDTT